MQMQHFLHRVNGGNIDAENQQQGGAGNSGQQHGGNCQPAADNQIQSLPEVQALKLNVKNTVSVPHCRNGSHNSGAKNREKQISNGFMQIFSFILQNEGNGTQRKPQKHGT